ncbi:MAG: efflux RND transporter periplasmic adaptor subunit [Rhodocyclaceae bacterium]|nr:efflux RND transporter periplasmic adaptor subunit [Rhodocyclaceae bacterium]
MKLAIKPEHKKRYLIGSALVLALILLVVVTRGGKKADEPAGSENAGPQPSLSVSVEMPLPMRMSQRISANGNIEAWQEAVIGANVSGLILSDVKVNVGDVVKKGQVLATFSSQTVAADLEQSRARAAEAEASALEAEANAERAQKVADSGALSAQQLNQYVTAAQTARARAKAQIAAERAQAVRLSDTRVVAPDDGVISSRTATVGAVPSGNELFRLIRQGRLEWRAEVPAPQLALLKLGMPVRVDAGSGIMVAGKLRMVSPSVDPKTRNGIVYVDLPQPSAGQIQVRAGMFAAGEIEVGISDGLTLPQSAVMVRDGYSYVFRVGADNKVQQTKVSLGRRTDERVEILIGLNPSDRVVVSGGGFLTDGDLVRVVTPASPDPAPAQAAVSK